MYVRCFDVTIFSYIRAAMLYFLLMTKVLVFETIHLSIATIFFQKMVIESAKSTLLLNYILISKLFCTINLENYVLIQIKQL